jgi:carnitine O-acetyltransferase
MSYSNLAVRILNMSKAGGEAILPSKLQLSGDGESPASHLSETMETKKQPNTSAVTSKPTAGKKGITFANQDSLPKLPIPDLESTCRKYLEALYPLQTPREHEDTKAAVQEFLKTDGPELQDKLKKYASSKTSYIEQFCMSAISFAE